MAVETKFVVVRKGEEKMTFANKKEADAYDKMLDMADTFTDWLLQSNIEIDEALAETIAMHLAEQKDAVQHILRTSKLPETESAPANVAAQSDVTEEADAQDEHTEDAQMEEQPEEAVKTKKVRAVKAA
ncbi:YebG family protein [Rahnella sp. Larv3_ips]|uniref:YebG family protein n=1 Tax=Rahnella sp. Larv3_ips TaxID=1896943 RepID=UPI000EFAFBBD|nr:YebG family protein [Rahnella sp. Larv3_ips]